MAPPEDEVRDLQSAGADLIRRAFEAARSSGKTDWAVMTTPVLKNRMLILSDRTFDQADWGAETVIEFVKLFGDIVELDLTTHPATVRLIDAEVDEVPEPDQPLGPRRRIRADLWDAVLDYSSGSLYVWSDGEAVAVASVGDDDVRPRLPTVSPDEFRGWRESFVACLPEKVVPPFVERLDSWKARGRTVDLPPRFRNTWTGYMKQRVLDALQTWFAANSIAVPDDLVQEVDAPTKRAGSDEAEHLRAFVISCVESMSSGELERLLIPASVLARMKR